VLKKGKKQKGAEKITRNAIAKKEKKKWNLFTLIRY
jgi:hypothetical protein